MEVFVTGATGFVGAHTALALLSEGHTLRLLVRDERFARAWFDARGQHIERFVCADIADRVAVVREMFGCDAVFHAAASVSLNRSEYAQTYANNLGAVQSVLGAAAELGIGHIVYVSSVTPLLQPGADRIDETAPLSTLSEPYSRSKRDGEVFARGLQRRGVPVQISYPTGVVGPDDPKLSATNAAVKLFLCQALPRTTSGLQCVDVRDLAQGHRWLLERAPNNDPEDDRYIIGGHFYPWDELRRLLESVTGRRLVSPRIPPIVMRAMGVAVDVIRRVAPFDTQISAEAMTINTRWSPADSSRYLRASALGFRPGAQTFADTIRWLAEAGHIPADKAGALGSGDGVIA